MNIFARGIACLQALSELKMYAKNLQFENAAREAADIREGGYTDTHQFCAGNLNPFFPTVPTCAVRETASLGIMGAPRVPPLNPSETIVF